jgi:hypothetical protein
MVIFSEKPDAFKYFFHRFMVILIAYKSKHIFFQWRSRKSEIGGDITWICTTGINYTTLWKCGM